jgi:hypothetical protein
MIHLWITWITAVLFLQETQGFQEDTFGLLSQVGQVNLVTSMSTMEYTFGFSCSRANSFSSTSNALDKIEKILDLPPFTHASNLSLDNNLSLWNIGISIKRHLSISKINIQIVENILLEYQSFGMDVTNKTNSITIDKGNFSNLDFKKIKGLEIFLEKQTLTNITEDSPFYPGLLNTALALDYSLESSNKALIELVNLLKDVTHIKLSQGSEEILSDLVNVNRYTVMQADITGLIIENSDIFFSIQVTYGKTFQQFQKQKSIPHFGYVLNKQFASNQTNLISISCNEKYCVPNDNDICAKALEDENVDRIFESCTFIKTDREYEFTPVGLFIYQIPTGDLKNFINNKGLKVEVVPSLLVMNGCLDLELDGLSMQGCYQNEPQIIPSRLINKGLDILLKPDFMSKLYNNISNGPLFLAICIINSFLSLIYCLTKAVFRKIVAKYYCKKFKLKSRNKITNIPMYNIRTQVKTNSKANNENSKRKTEEIGLLDKERLHLSSGQIGANPRTIHKATSKIKDTAPLNRPSSSSSRSKTEK